MTLQVPFLILQFAKIQHLKLKPLAKHDLNLLRGYGRRSVAKSEDFECFLTCCRGKPTKHHIRICDLVNFVAPLQEMHESEE